jgi:hypothetical protein
MLGRQAKLELNLIVVKRSAQSVKESKLNRSNHKQKQQKEKTI